MHFCNINTVLLLAGTAAAACAPFPPSLATYSSQFQQPKPPMLKPEFQTHLVQHKW
jgi:hypothetical protein